MEPNELKNILFIISAYLDCNRPFSIKNDPHNNLEFFLDELNRYRKLVNIPPAIIDKKIKLLNGEYRVCFQNLPPPILQLTNDKISLDKITENNFAIKLHRIFGPLVTEKQNNETLFIKSGSGGSTGLKERLHIGSWSKSKGWYWKPATL
jgi:hypothetical protein